MSSNLEQAINIKFNDKELLKNAFVHRSYLNEHSDFELGSNERMEFLGDAVLELITSEFLFEKYPQRPEGELTSIRAALVRTESLAEEAGRLGFGKYLLLSKGEEDSGGREREYILANTFEAFTGALYLDQGYEEAERFVTENLLYKAEKIVEDQLHLDPKSLFQEIVQEKVGVTPIYKLLEEWGPDHDKRFKMGVFVNNDLASTGEGTSKQAGEEDAANQALEEWNKS